MSQTRTKKQIEAQKKNRDETQKILKEAIEQQRNLLNYKKHF